MLGRGGQVPDLVGVLVETVEVGSPDLFRPLAPELGAEVFADQPEDVGPGDALLRAEEEDQERDQIFLARAQGFAPRQ
jgi:hypothetical protein